MTAEYKEWLHGLRFADRVVVRECWPANSSSPPGPPRIIRVRGTTGSRVWAGADTERTAPGYSRTTGYQFGTAGAWPRPRLEPLTPEVEAEVEAHAARVAAEEAERKRTRELRDIDRAIESDKALLQELCGHINDIEQRLAELRIKRAALEDDHG